MQRSSTARARKYRAAMREAGMRLVQIWAPDTRSPDFAEKCRRQSLSLRGNPHEAEILPWLSEVGDDRGWE